jgi:iron(II)-dependent oxidoreductase
MSGSKTRTNDILDALQEARRRTLVLVVDLDDRQLFGPRLAIVNPPLWEIGHVAYFQEFWCLRHFRGERPVLNGSDNLYDSARIPHDTRWDLPLPSLHKTLSFMQQVLDRVVDLNLSSTDRVIEGYDQNYFLELALFHEQMHAEALTYTRQTLGYAAPRFRDPDISRRASEHGAANEIEGDAFVPGGRFVLGNDAGSRFAFDNERLRGS